MMRILPRALTGFSAAQMNATNAERIAKLVLLKITHHLLYPNLIFARDGDLHMMNGLQYLMVVVHTA